MAVVKLSVEALAKIAEGEMWRDTEVKGLIATRTKSAVVFKVQHDLRGKTVRMTLKTGDLKEARAQARIVKNQISAGIDPRLPEPVAEVGPEAWTVRECIEKYLAKPDLRETTKTAIRDHVQYLGPLLPMRLDSLTKSLVRETHAKLPKRTVADGAFRYFRAAYNYAIKFDDAKRLEAVDDHRPYAGIAWGKPKARKPIAFDLKEWGEALKEVTPVRRQFHLLLLTGGLRKSTGWSTTWDMIDLPSRVIRYDAATMKSDRDFHLPLSDYMVELIESIPRLDRKWVFPASSKSGHITEAKEPELGQAVAHQLRKRHYTVGLALGISEAHLGALHDHSQPGLEKNYGSRAELFDVLLNHQQRISAALRKQGLPKVAKIV